MNPNTRSPNTRSQNTNLPKSVIDEDLTDIFTQLTVEQARFVVARLDSRSDREAAEKIGVAPRTVYNWPPETRALIKQAIDCYLSNVTAAALGLLRSAVLKATLIKVEDLDADDARIRQDAATEILDRVLGRPRLAVDLDGGPIEVKGYVTISPDQWDEEESARATRHEHDAH